MRSERESNWVWWRQDWRVGPLILNLFTRLLLNIVIFLRKHQKLVSSFQFGIVKFWKQKTEYTCQTIFLLRAPWFLENKNKKRAKTPSLRQRVSSWENLSHKQINITIYFENLSDELHILYVFNIHIKFRSNQMLIIIRSINVFFMHNLKLQKLEI